MDTPGAADGLRPLTFNPRNNEDAAMMTSNYIDLTVEEDVKSESDDDELVELTPAQMETAMAERNTLKEEDTLDVSKLNYSFTLICRNSVNMPLDKQFIAINMFLRTLDRHNPGYEFTHAQYRRAWGHAVKLQENNFAINHILKNNLASDRAGIEAEFARQIQEIVDKIYRFDVTTPYERNLYLHGRASQTLASAIQNGNEKKIKATMKRMLRMEQTYGIVRDPALLISGANFQRTVKTKPAPKKARKNPKKDISRIVLASRVSKPRARKPRRVRDVEEEEGEDAPIPQNSLNLLPLTFNRLGDRVVKEPTPEPEVDDTLGLEAYKARQSMTMIPASAPSPTFPPEVTPAPHFEQENFKPNLVPSSGYYGVSSHEKMPERQDEEMGY